MSARVRSAVVALIALVALVVVLSLLAGAPLLIPGAVLAVAVLAMLVSVARWRPERIALLLVAIVVAGGTVASGVGVVNGVADSSVPYRGKLDVHEVRRTFHPTGPSGTGDPLPRIRRLGYGYISSAQGVMTIPRPSSGALVLWSIQELAPWLLAAIVLALLVPILRAAERGKPFSDGATRRLATIGVLALVGIPGVLILQFVAAEAASGGNSVAPVVAPALQLSTIHFVPGVLVLVLARVFRRGGELRDFERHAV